MPKILSDKAHQELKAKADNYDALVNEIVSSNEGMTAEEVTPEFIQGALKSVVDSPDNTSAERITELEGQVNSLTTERDTLKSEKDTLTTERNTLKSENEELRNLPGAESVSKKNAVVESSASETDDVLEYAKKNPTDTAGIAAKWQSENK